MTRTLKGRSYTNAYVISSPFYMEFTAIYAYIYERTKLQGFLSWRRQAWVQPEHKVHQHRFCSPALSQYTACKCLRSKLLAHCAHTQHHRQITVTIIIITVLLTKIRWLDFIFWNIVGKDISIRYSFTLERLIPSMLFPLWQHLLFFFPQLSSVSCYFYFVTCRFALISSGIMLCKVDVRTFRMLSLYILGSALVFFPSGRVERRDLIPALKGFVLYHLFLFNNHKTLCCDKAYVWTTHRFNTDMWVMYAISFCSAVCGIALL
jgi:hypothetical protein